MTRIAMLFFIGLALTAPGRAQADTKGGSSYCFSGTAVMAIDSKEEDLKKVAERCRPGDTIAIPAGRGGELPVARLCDFNKAIVIAGGNVVCVLAETRPMRGQPLSQERIDELMKQRGLKSN